MNLDEIRKEIDTLDQQMVSLFAKRMKLSQKVAIYKNENGLKIENLKREREIVTRLAEQFPEYEKEIQALYQEIFRMSKDYQKTLMEGMSIRW